MRAIIESKLKQVEAMIYGQVIEARVAARLKDEKMAEDVKKQLVKIETVRDEYLEVLKDLDTKKTAEQ
jgi:hypothetical protein